MHNVTNTGLDQDEETISASDRSRRGMNDFNGEMRRGGRGGGSFRSHSSKEPGTVGPYFEILYKYSVYKWCTRMNKILIWVRYEGENIFLKEQ